MENMYIDALNTARSFADEKAVNNAEKELKAASVLSADAVIEGGDAPDEACIKSSLRALAQAALLCIENAALPYDTSKVIAQGFLQLQCDHLRKTIIDVCGLEYAPELVYLVETHYQRSKCGDADEDRARVQIKKRAYTAGYRYEKDYKGCAQCTLATMFDITGRTEPMLFQAATGLAGGMARCGDGACGGYSGGILFMGALCGRRLDHFDGDAEAKQQAYKTAELLHDKMMDVYGSIRCKDIHTQIFGRSYLIRDSEDCEKFEEAGAHQHKCTNVVGFVSMLIAEILMDEGYLAP